MVQKKVDAGMVNIAALLWREGTSAPLSKVPTLPLVVKSSGVRTSGVAGNDLS